MDEVSKQPTLPMTWRPRAMRWVAYGLALLILATMGVLSATLPVDWRIQDRVMLFGLGLAIAAVLHLLGRPRLVATQRNVTIVNSIRTHVLAWPEIIDAQMREGEPWPSVDLSDGSTLAVMGIQSADGELARRQLGEFQALLHERGETQEPDRDGS
ncbi:PH (Pleckstrin Homology) domain-containing protein [Nocardiopsis sp. Huas11]|uniref:PH domain-containing protein n=1 Tax=Nocardiopsis sp. Huas11 TaxID=2183912 RepID=UPI000EB29FD1|nr:PH domain-containing protein [Nocardiopsis sp. Huas11]RKS09883.1 PH (Pleckstrin Homology) domain-containing protein [Nocardiopsis sp. Huas11]